MINWTRVAELKEEIGVEDFGEVVELFLSEVEDCLEQLDTSKGPSEVEADMHFLKGSALNLGFQDFAALCEAGERNASQGGTSTVNVAQILDSFTRSKRAFAQCEEGAA